jgi:hypothetical protein
MRTVLQTRIARALNHQRPSPERQREHLFTVTLFLDGITPDDYMQWIRDPEPPNRDDLKLITATATALGDTIQLELLSTGAPLPAAVAASAVGFPITPEVIEPHSRVIDAQRIGGMPRGVPRRHKGTSPRPAGRSPQFVNLGARRVVNVPVAVGDQLGVALRHERRTAVRSCPIDPKARWRHTHEGIPDEHTTRA